MPNINQANWRSNDLACVRAVADDRIRNNKYVAILRTPVTGFVAVTDTNLASHRIPTANVTNGAIIDVYASGLITLAGGAGTLQTIIRFGGTATDLNGDVHWRHTTHDPAATTRFQLWMTGVMRTDTVADFFTCDTQSFGMLGVAEETVTPYSDTGATGLTATSGFHVKFSAAWTAPDTAVFALTTLAIRITAADVIF